MPNKMKTAGKGGFSDLNAATRRAVFSFIVLIALFALFAVMSPDKFLAATNLQNLLQQVVTYTIIGCGLSFCLVCGGNDLSAGASMALSGIIVVNLLIMGLPIWLCIILCLCMGVLTGVMNGFFIEILGVVPFVATLATQWVYRGMANVLVNGAPVYTTNIPSEQVQQQFYMLGGGRIGGDGLPYSVIITAVYAIILGIVLAKTRIGRQIYACGSNLEAAKLSGINAVKTRMFAYCISGLSAAICLGPGRYLDPGRRGHHPEHHHRRADDGRHPQRPESERRQLLLAAGHPRLHPADRRRLPDRQQGRPAGGHQADAGPEQEVIHLAAARRRAAKIKEENL